MRTDGQQSLTKRGLFFNMSSVIRQKPYKEQLGGEGVFTYNPGHFSNLTDFSPFKGSLEEIVSKYQ